MKWNTHLSSWRMWALLTGSTLTAWWYQNLKSQPSTREALCYSTLHRQSPELRMESGIWQQRYPLLSCMSYLQVGIFILYWASTSIAECLELCVAIMGLIMHDERQAHSVLSCLSFFALWPKEHTTFTKDYARNEAFRGVVQLRRHTQLGISVNSWLCLYMLMFMHVINLSIQCMLLRLWWTTHYVSSSPRSSSSLASFLFNTLGNWISCQFLGYHKDLIMYWAWN